ncbi:MAG: hypothetical protein PVH87_19305 [Desulfobacteraceae bacterium]|jgi:hypothetical protein
MEIASASISPSLLPYLNPRRDGIYFQFTFQAHARTAQRTFESESSGPFTTLRHAYVTLDGSQRLLEVICVHQPDIYTIEQSELNPLTNLDVESIWQQTWARLSKLDEETRPFVLPCQISGEGGLVPLRPLFYCLHSDRFCHPVCPICGGTLDLCRDDNLLMAAGIPTYSGSLERYLYCQSCHGNEAGAPFYARTLKKEPSAKVADSDTLIESFSRLLAKSDLSDRLPCIGCDETANCYGPETLVLKRMQPLQFYPFHMLMQHAPPLNAVEFIALLAGAEPGDIEPLSFYNTGVFGLDRSKHLLPSLSQGAGFLYRGDNRFFLEVLYLKLTFLQELHALVQQRAFFPVSRMSLEGVGVEIHAPGSKLPGYWHFSLKLTDPIGHPNPHSPGSKLPGILTNEFLGLAWFYVLLVNGKQQMARVNSALQEGMARTMDEKHEHTEMFRHAAFDPGNIFWHPQTLELEPQWLALWLEALAQGGVLVKAGQGDDSDFSESSFEQQVEHLRDRVHRELFKLPRAVHPFPGQRRIDSDARIEAILSNILAKWPQAEQTSSPENGAPEVGAPEVGTPEVGTPEVGTMDQPPASKKAVDGRVNEDGDYVETVVLSADELAALAGKPGLRETAADVGETVIISPAQGQVAEKATVNDLEETVVLKSQQESPGVPQPSDDALDPTVAIAPKPKHRGEGEPDETVIISPPSAPPPPAQPLTDDENLDETVVLKPAQKTNGQEDLEKTVFIPPPGQTTTSFEGLSTADTPSTEKQEKLQEEELDETVIIQPSNDQRRKPKE